MPDRPKPVPLALDAALALVRAPFGQTIDLVVRRLTLGPPPGSPAAIIYFEGLIDRVALEQHVLAPLQQLEPALPGCDLLALARGVISVSQVRRVHELERTVDALAKGQAVLLCEGGGAALLLDVAKVSGRQVRESEIEPVVRGPRQAFVEDLGTNLALVRHVLSDVNLRFERFQLGSATHTSVVLGYLEGRADRRVLARIRRCLRRMRTAQLFGSRPLEEMLFQGRWSVFPLSDSTERPDRVVAGLIEGRIAILIQGVPTAMMLPVTLWHLLQSPEDYHTVAHHASFTRVMRLLGMLAVLALPSFYVALTSYHLELLPTVLALSMNSAHAGVPFPGLVEALLLELIFEAVREAGIRLPKPAGQAVTIVGGLIIGQAAIQARMVSPMMVIVVAATGVASFTIPHYPLAVALRVLRFPIMFLSGVLGLFGFMIALFAILIYLCGLQSFGVPYLSPLAPLGEARDILLRPPHRPDGGRRRLGARR